MSDSDDSASALWTLFEDDLVKIVAAIGLVYGIFVVAGVLLGTDLNGHFNRLRTLTFFIAVFAMAVLALNLHWGYTGLFNIGVAGFMAVGVYAFAIATNPPTASPSGFGLPFVVGILLGILAAAVMGAIVALPALRLRADYLAIVTIAMAEIIRFSFRAGTFSDVTGGGAGIPVTKDPDTQIIGFLVDDLGFGIVYDPFASAMLSAGVNRSVLNGWIYAVVLFAFVVGFYVLLTRIGHSPFGRVLKAVREDEDVARALGKDTQKFKIFSFMIGCGLLGLAGILWQASRGYVNPNNNFLPQLTFFIWIALIIGGAGSNTGNVLGSALFVGLLFEGPRLLAGLIDNAVGSIASPSTFAGAVGSLTGGEIVPFLGYFLDNIQTLKLVFMGIALIWLMQNRPEGLLGHRKDTAATIDLSRPNRTASETAAEAAADGGEPDE